VNFSTWLVARDLSRGPLQPGCAGSDTAERCCRLAAICAGGYARLQWWVLGWNEAAQGFYRQLGARPMDEWTVWRVAGEALDRLGAPTEPPVTGSQPTE
jgi:hypothetical protein